MYGCDDLFFKLEFSDGFLCRLHLPEAYFCLGSALSKAAVENYFLRTSDSWLELQPDRLEHFLKLSFPSCFSSFISQNTWAFYSDGSNFQIRLSKNSLN